jgi:hypothetical protein
MTDILPVGNGSTIPFGNLPFGIDLYSCDVPHKIHDRTGAIALAYVETLQKRRHERFVSWVSSIGGQTAAVEKLDKSQSQISLLMAGKKPIGETLARDIEVRAGLPFGWLDDDDAADKKKNSIPQDALTKKLMTIWLQLPNDDRRELAGMAAGLLRRPSDAEDSGHARRAATRA